MIVRFLLVCVCFTSLVRAIFFTSGSLAPIPGGGSLRPVLTPSPDTAFPRKEKFAIHLAGPRKGIKIFSEVAQTLHYGLLSLGFDSVILENQIASNRRHIILAAFDRKIEDIPPGSIIYNFDQTISPILKRNYYRDMMVKFETWDASQLNIVQHELVYGIRGIRFVPLGHVPQLFSQIQADEDLDVLLLAARSPRRDAIVIKLKEMGLRVLCIQDVFGDERATLIARSKIVLNVHYYDNATMFETVRAMIVLQAGKLLVSETSNDPIEAHYKDAVVFSTYENLVETCVMYSRNPDARESIRALGVPTLKAMDEGHILASALNLNLS